jgi:ribose-phosphate pyrophosphokinase
MSAAVFVFEEDVAPAQRLGNQLGAPLRRMRLHVFPDGENLPVVPTGHQTALLYRGLDHPNAKLISLLLAADALRRSGTEWIVLVAPYMPYLRQDKVFAPGQPLSRDVFARLLAPPFDRIVTVEPHLHRTSDLQAVFPGPSVTTLSVAELFAKAVGPGGDPLIVGPDAESEPWVRAVADRIGADWLVLHKTRAGDREVTLDVPKTPEVRGRRVMLIDDICASGGTLLAAATALHSRGAASVEALVAHALFSAETSHALTRAGLTRIASTDSCRHPSNRIYLASLLAEALQEELDP